jgi:hypothetical protein
MNMKDAKGDTTKCLGGGNLTKRDLLKLFKSDRIIIESDRSEHDSENLEEPCG